MTVRYLDVDDEITTAVARLRATDAPDVLLVLPVGSRLATSRINFRLLAAEARNAGKTLAIATPEAPVRALAVAAGLPAYGSAGEYDAVLAGTAEPSIPAEPVAASVGATSGSNRVAPSRLRRAAVLPRWAGSVDRRLAGWLGGALVLAVLVVAGVAAAIVLPSAEITVRPRVSAAGPLVVEVTADPKAEADDPAAGIIRAGTVDLPLRANERFPASGADVTLTKATGTVRFRSENTLFDVTVPANTQVSTPSGIAFVTTRAVVVPHASFATGPTSRSTSVEAVEGGTSGNVEADTITTEPATLRAALVTVTNPDPTSGGSRSETHYLARADYDAAVQLLTERLDDALEAAVADRAKAAEDTVIHSATATRGLVAVTPAASEVVGTLTRSFELTATATGRVTAVDEARLRPIAESHLRASLAADSALLPDSVVVEVGQAGIEGDSVHYKLTVRGEEWQRLDPATLLGQVKGRSVEDARDRLAAYGEVEIATWPSFLESIPMFDGRVSVLIEPPGTPER